MEIIETAVFTKQVRAEMSDEEYCALQLALIARPEAGDPSSGHSGSS